MYSSYVTDPEVPDYLHLPPPNPFIGRQFLHLSLHYYVPLSLSLSLSLFLPSLSLQPLATDFTIKQPPPEPDKVTY